MFTAARGVVTRDIYLVSRAAVKTTAIKKTSINYHTQWRQLTYLNEQSDREKRVVGAAQEEM